MGRPRSQKGAALIVVLLMVATLSFVAIGITERAGLAAKRTANSADRSQAYWRAMSVEVFASVALREILDAAESGPLRLTVDHPLFLAPVDAPLPDGTAQVQFADATRCFNVNSLVAVGSGADDAPGRRQGLGQGLGRGLGGGLNEASAVEFANLLAALGVSDAEARRLAMVAADWIDANAERAVLGAEDDFYTSLPAPFRTGGAPLADISEMRAMDGVTPQLYRALRLYACARPKRTPSRLNVNMLRPQDAPLITALTRGLVPVSEAVEVIAARPPEGWENIGEFWAHEAFAEAISDGELDSAMREARTSVTSEYIEVRAALGVNDITIRQRLMFEASAEAGGVTLIWREFGVGL